MTTDELKADTIEIIEQLKSKIRSEIDKTERAINN